MNLVHEFVLAGKTVERLDPKKVYGILSQEIVAEDLGRGSQRLTFRHYLHTKRSIS